MIPIQIRYLATRAGRVVAFAVLSAAFAIAACSSDPRNSLGSDDDLINSTPGVVFEDTLDVFADTVLAYDGVVYFGPMDFGRVSGYQRSMVLQFPFTIGTQDSVRRARLRLPTEEISGTIPGRFYQLTFPYAQGDSIPSLDTLAVIPNPTTGGVTRSLQAIPREYELPPLLVQGWLRRTIDRNAMAVIYPDPVTDRIATFYSAEADSGNRPLIIVNFVNGNIVNYRDSDDANFIRPTTTTSNLVTSDGYVRRIYFRIPLDQLPERSAVHIARLRLHVVAGSVLGDNTNLIVYLPASDDVTSDEFLSGTNVTAISVPAGAEYIEFTMTNAIALTLQGSIEDNGVVIRFDAENSSLRQVQFYGSNAPDSLRPRLYITSSTPADFDPETP